jgi:acyl carrier protein
VQRQSMKEISEDIISRELCTYIKSMIVDKQVVVEPMTDFSQLGIDSLSLIELVLFIERKFNIALPEEDLLPENFKSAETLAKCACRHLTK